MKNFVVYLPTGEIIRYGTCPDDHLEDQANDGETVIEGVPQENVYVVDGEIVKLPAKPGDDYEFDYEQKQWVYNKAAAAALAVHKRQELLVASDYTQLPDVTITNREAWAVYRQELRDITTQQGFPQSIVWPTAPQ
jgi:hypothetical protein